MIEICDDYRLNEYFTLKELSCYDNGKYVYKAFKDSYKFNEALYRFRCWYNRPIIINSGYRTPIKNKTVGGSINSSHLYAMAIDFRLPQEYMEYSQERKDIFLENVKKAWSDICKFFGYKAQVNYYDSYIHIGFSLSNKNSYLDKRTK